MLEWALIIMIDGKAEVVTMAASETQCWMAAARSETPPGSVKACFTLATVFETAKQKTPE